MPGLSIADENTLYQELLSKMPVLHDPLHFSLYAEAICGLRDILPVYAAAKSAGFSQMNVDLFNWAAEKQQNMEHVWNANFISDSTVPLKDICDFFVLRVLVPRAISSLEQANFLDQQSLRLRELRLEVCNPEHKLRIDEKSGILKWQISQLINQSINQSIHLFMNWPINQSIKGCNGAEKAKVFDFSVWSPGTFIARIARFFSQSIHMMFQFVSCAILIGHQEDPDIFSHQMRQCALFSFLSKHPPIMLPYAPDMLFYYAEKILSFIPPLRTDDGHELLSFCQTKDEV